MNKKLDTTALKNEIEKKRKFILCGSKEFMSCIQNYLVELDVDKSDISRL